MSTDALTQARLQEQQAQRQLAQSELELDAARREADENRRIIVVAIGQRFVPEVFSSLASGKGSEESTRRLKAMTTAQIAALIANALNEKMTRLEAFMGGLTLEQRDRVVQHILETAPIDWLHDPQFAEARKRIESSERARTEAEERARQAEESLRAVEARQMQAGVERLRLQEEIERLQNALAVQRNDHRIREEDHPSSVTPIPSLEMNEGVSVVSSEPGKETSGVDSNAMARPTSSATELGERAHAHAIELLVFVIATRGYCERPRLEEILHREHQMGTNANTLLINRAFVEAEQQGLVESVRPRTEIGFGRAPHLVRLSPKGIEIARETLKVEPVPSELTRLLKLHDSAEHVALILTARRLFEERYPEPIERVNLFPEPVSLSEGKRSEPDLSVVLRSGKILLVECERDTPKNEAQRDDKWSKYHQATDGNFYVFTPTAAVVSRMLNEIGKWYVDYQMKTCLHITSAFQILTGAAPNFWVRVQPYGSSE